jgi:hypothetical protein
MTEQYRCNECGHFVEVPDDAICEVCNIGIMQHLRYTRGGDGSHWEGCDEIHWDCKIAKLEKENKKLKHALEVIADSEGHHDHSLTHSQLIEYAKEALE